MEFRQHRVTDEKKPTRYFSSRQEKKVAKAIGGKTVANSGAVPWAAGDITTDNMSGWLCECKTSMTDKKSFTLQKEWFDKNRDESIFMKKDYSAVVFSFGPSSPNYYIVDEATFLEMKEALELMKKSNL